MLLSRTASGRRIARAALMGAAAGTLALGRARPASSEVSLEHTPPACLLAESTPRLVACLQPRSQKGTLRVLFRAVGGEAWYAAALRSDVPCYTGLLPRPNRATGAVEYVLEAEGAFGVVRSPAHTVLVVADAAACAGRTAPLAAGRASWEAPSGAPRTPAGFEGAAPPRPGPVDRTPSRPAAAAPAARPPTAAPPAPSAPPTPRPPATAPAPPSDAGSGGHGLRNAALIVGGAAVVGGGALAVAGRNDGSNPPATTGTGLPTSGVSGVYVGVETVDYGGCTGTDDIVLNLQEAGGALSGVLSFTVRTCPCCSTGRGANPVRGVLAGTTLELTTPSGFGYQGAFAGNRLSGSLAGPGGIRGTWTVDKR